MLRFFKRNILARFAIPALVISDNGTQFTDHKFQEYLRNLNIKQSLTSVKHPQSNGVCEAANRVILRIIQRRLDEIKTSWVGELHKVLWASWTTSHSTTGKSPFRITYGTEAVIPIEANELSWRTSTDTDFDTDAENLREKLEFIDEVRTEASLSKIALKQKIASRHNKRVIKR